MLRSSITLSLLGVIALGGCATKLTSQLVTATDNTKVDGATYYLPRQSVRVNLSFELTKCVNATTMKGNDGKEVVDKSPDIQLRKTATITTVSSPDVSAQYLIPTASLRSPLKTTELEVETFENGVLQSIGVDVDDRTSEIISSSIQSAGSVARLVSGLTDLECRPEITDALSKRDELRRDLRIVGNFDTTAKRAGAVDVLNRLNALLTLTVNFSYTPSHSVLSYKYEGDDRSNAIFDRWFIIPVDKDTRTDEQRIDELVKNSGLRAKIVTTSCLQSTNDGGLPETDETDDCPNTPKLSVTSTPASGGVVYRDPRRYRIVVCDGSCKDVVSESETPKNLIASSIGTFAQLGPWRRIHLSSRAFQDRSVTATWNNAGRLTALTTGSSSDLESIASSLNTGLSSINQTVGEVTSTELESVNAELAIIRARADLIEQQRRLQMLEDEPDGSSVVEE